MLHLLLSFNFMFHTYAVFLNIVHLYGPLRMSHATKYILNIYSDMSYAERCIQLSILPLCFRREIIDLMLFYKYLHNYVDCDFELVGSLHSLPRHVCDASSVFSFEKHNELFFSLLRNFNINERCTWSLVCTCGFCRS